MSFQEKLQKYIVPNITESVVSLFNYNTWRGPSSFYTWLVSSDQAFEYIYNSEFKTHFRVFFTPKTSEILKIYSHNLMYSVCSFFENDADHSRTVQFIRKMINYQLKNIDFNILFEN
jgi:hypothetical protein